MSFGVFVIDSATLTKLHIIVSIDYGTNGE